MPTYEYRCDACGHEFELFQQMSDPVKRKCPACGKSKLQRLIGAGAGVIFKGGGFYETDYRSDSYKKDQEAAKKAAEPKTETKADAADGAKSSGASEPAAAEKSGSKPSTDAKDSRSSSSRSSASAARRSKPKVAAKTAKKRK